MSDDLSLSVDAYGAGLDAELALLRQLQRLAVEQQEATYTHDLDRLNRVGDDRERVMAALVAVEHELKPVRSTLSSHRDDVKDLPGYEDLMTLHRAASHLVAEILAADNDTMQALREAELARRFAAHSIQTGQTTLAAYRRVVAPPVANAALVDRRG